MSNRHLFVLGGIFAALSVLIAIAGATRAQSVIRSVVLLCERISDTKAR